MGRQHSARRPLKSRGLAPLCLVEYSTLWYSYRAGDAER